MNEYQRRITGTRITQLLCIVRFYFAFRVMVDGCMEKYGKPRLNSKKGSSFQVTAMFDLASEWACHRLSTLASSANIARLRGAFQMAGCLYEKQGSCTCCPRRGERDEIVFRTIGCWFNRNSR